MQKLKEHVKNHKKWYILGVLLFALLISGFEIFNRNNTVPERETVTVNELKYEGDKNKEFGKKSVDKTESNDDSNVLVEDEKKPEKVEDIVEIDKPKETTKPTTDSNQTKTPSTDTPQPKQPSTEPTPVTKQTTHIHSWETQYKTVHHDATGHYETKTVVDREAYDETVVTGSYDEVVCIACGQKYSSVSEWYTHSEQTNDEHGNYTVETHQTYSTVHHDAVTHTEQYWVQDTASYDEQVENGQKCSSCGATK